MEAAEMELQASDGQQGRRNEELEKSAAGMETPTYIKGLEDEILSLSARDNVTLMYFALVFFSGTLGTL